MDIYDFAVSYPQLYQKIDNEVQHTIDTFHMNGEESLRDLDNYVEGIVVKYNQQDLYGNNANPMVMQQYCRDCDDWDRYGDRGRGRDRHHRHRDFDIRDLTRIIFLRRLFDRNRHRHY